MTQSLTILGATGTIGQQALQLVEAHPERFSLTALTAESNVTLLAEQAKRYRPAHVVIGNEKHYDALQEALAGTDITVSAGANALEEIAAVPTDITLSAIIGAAALAPTLAAIAQGNRVALANKESLVCGGTFVMEAVQQHGTTLIPVDSEHNTLFQLLGGAEVPSEVQSLTLTASGGPFLRQSREAMQRATPKEAITHPNWQMGAKISVDSATMMNKGLELIEACHLFAIQESQVEVLVPPESIIHGMVHYHDGMVLAGLAMPDMRVPLSFALGWPARMPNAVKPLDLATLGTLHFEAPDLARFPALTLARAAMAAGGTAPAILNAANESAVEAFLAGHLRLTDITDLIASALDETPALPLESLAHLQDVHHHVQQQMRTAIAKKAA